MTNIQVERTFRHDFKGFRVLTAYKGNMNDQTKSMNLFFSSWPTTSKEFTVVEFLNYHRQLTPDEMGISINLPTVDTFYSTGLSYIGVSPLPADKVLVEVVDGKLKIEIPQMSGYTITATYIDSALFKGSFQEQ